MNFEKENEKKVRERLTKYVNVIFTDFNIVDVDYITAMVDMMMMSIRIYLKPVKKTAGEAL